MFCFLKFYLKCPHETNFENGILFSKNHKEHEHAKLILYEEGIFQKFGNTPVIYAAQLRQPIENSLVLCHLKTLRLNTGFFKFGLDHYLTNVARVKSTYWG